MIVRFGNLGLDTVIKSEYISKVKDFLDSNDFYQTDKCDDIGERLGNYHIFDVPRVMIICGDMKMQEFIDFMVKDGLGNEAVRGSLDVDYYPLIKA